MILGIGVEWVELPRFERSLERFGERLLARVFTPEERAYAARKRRGAESLAARFAAKTAARRALAAASGRVASGRWHDYEVVRAPGRAPSLRLHGRAADDAKAAGVAGTALSLTHDRGACLAHVVVEGRESR